MSKEQKTFDIPAAVRSEDVVLVTNVLTALEALDKCEAYKVPHAYHSHTAHIQLTYRSHTAHIPLIYSSHTAHIQLTYSSHAAHMQLTYLSHTASRLLAPNMYAIETNFGCARRWRFYKRAPRSASVAC